MYNRRRVRLFAIPLLTKIDKQTDKSHLTEIEIYTALYMYSQHASTDIQRDRKPQKLECAKNIWPSDSAPSIPSGVWVRHIDMQRNHWAHGGISVECVVLFQVVEYRTIRILWNVNSVSCFPAWCLRVTCRSVKWVSVNSRTHSMPWKSGIQRAPNFRAGWGGGEGLGVRLCGGLSRNPYVQAIDAADTHRTCRVTRVFYDSLVPRTLVSAQILPLWDTQKWCFHVLVVVLDLIRMLRSQQHPWSSILCVLHVRMFQSSKMERSYCILTISPPILSANMSYSMVGASHNGVEF